MQKKRIALILLLCFSLSLPFSATAKKAPKEILISQEAEHNPISKDVFGLSLEDTTTSLETGLYANFVYNSSFEEAGPSASLPGWELFGAYTIETVGGVSSNNQKYLTLPEGKTQKIKNLGFCEANMQTKSKKKKQDKNECKASMGVEAGQGYVFSAWMKNTNTIVTVSLENEKGEKLSETNTFIVTVGSQWQKFTFPLSAAKTDYGYLLIEFAGGPVSIDDVSLVPQESYGMGKDNFKQVPLRKDLFDALKDANPAFLRFPVVCSLKAEDSASFSWKRTIGPLEERKPASSLPTEEIMQYNSSRAIGYHEMLQMAEEIGATPVPVFDVTPLYRVEEKPWAEDAVQNAEATKQTEENTTKAVEPSEPKTDAAQAQPNEHKSASKLPLEKQIYMADTEEFKNFVTDVLDAIAYAKDQPYTPWGKKRVENGHLEAFSVTQIVLKSNAVKDEAYLYLAKQCKEEIQKVFPNLSVLVASDFTLPQLLEAEAQYAAEQTPTPESAQQPTETATENETEKEPATYAMWREAFAEEEIMFDLRGIDEKGELQPLLESMQTDAIPTVPCSLNQYFSVEGKRGKIYKSMDMEKALLQAKFMLLAETQSEKLSKISFAPVLTRMDVPNAQSGLVLFNAHASIRTPNYLAMQLFLNHMGTELLAVPAPDNSEALYQSVSIDAEKEVLYVKLVNAKESTETLSFKVDGFGDVQYADTLSIAHNKASAYNGIGNTNISIQKNELLVLNNAVEVQLPQNSIAVLRIAYGQNKADENLYQLPKIIEPTRRYTTEQKNMASNVLAAIAGVGIVIYITVYFTKRKKNKTK